ncbi:MAG: insulinase family protein [Bacteroidia bacterium]|nr:insulinase family protein [Bacteroidia bacterium]MDW8088156.1 insulinase family protein [Bacteroidia bacterium]
MKLQVHFHPPQLPQEGPLGQARLYWLEVAAPLARLWAVWEAPALPTYPPFARKILLQLLSEENQRYGPGGISQRLHRLGWEFEWSATKDHFFLSAEGLAENLSTAVFYLGEALEGLICFGLRVDIHLRRAAAEQARALANPAYRADAHLDRLLWEGSYAPTALLSPTDILSTPHESIWAYYRDFLLRGLRHIIVAAPYLPKPLLAWGQWAKPLTYGLKVAPLHPSRSYAEADPQAKQASLRLAYSWVPPSHPHYGYYQLALMRLGGYFGAQLMRRIREEAGLTYGIYAKPQITRVKSCFIITAEVARSRAEEAYQKIHEEVSQWQQNPFPEPETLEEVRNYLLAQLMPEGPGEWGQRLSRWVAMGVTPQAYLAYGYQIEHALAGAWPPLELPNVPLAQVEVGQGVCLHPSESCPHASA